MKRQKMPNNLEEGARWLKFEGREMNNEDRNLYNTEGPHELGAKMEAEHGPYR